jgi:hypothetical protein
MNWLPTTSTPHDVKVISTFVPLKPRLPENSGTNEPEIATTAAANATTAAVTRFWLQRSGPVVGCANAAIGAGYPGIPDSSPMFMGGASPMDTGSPQHELVTIARARKRPAGTPAGRFAN